MITSLKLSMSKTSFFLLRAFAPSRETIPSRRHRKRKQEVGSREEREGREGINNYKRRWRSLVCASIAAISISVGSTSPAYALFGLPSIVFDPSNLAQNVLTAARTLAMINNQIKSLVNEAQMLTRLDKQLLQLGYNVAPQLKSDLDQIKLLMKAAQTIAYTVHDTEATFANLFPQAYTAATTSNQLLMDARSRWDLSRKAWRDTLVLQARVVETLPTDISKLDELVSQSQGAQGQLQATQAGNQIIALNTKQQIQLQQLMAAQYRADAIEKARDTEAEAQAREEYKRFLGDPIAYH